VLDPAWATSEANASGAALVIELEQGVLAAYQAAREAGTRLAGVCNWPIPFIMC
jgi:hypothetical protein